MLGDVASSLLTLGGIKSASPSNPNVDATLTSLLTSWEHVRSTLVSMQTLEEPTFREMLSMG
jgi:hypothetical protein